MSGGLRFASGSLLSVGLPLVGVAVLGAGVGYWLPWLEGAGSGGAAAFVAGVAVFCGAALAPAQVSGLIGGFVYGHAEGAGLALAGVVLAGLLGYSLFARLLARSWESVADRRPRIARIRQLIGGGGPRSTLIMAALLRIAPLMPFSGTNLLFGASRARVAPFFFGTLLGFAPLALLWASTGAELAELRLDSEHGSTWLTITLLLASIFGISIVAKQQLRRVIDAESEAKSA